MTEIIRNMLWGTDRTDVVHLTCQGLLYTMGHRQD